MASTIFQAGVDRQRDTISVRVASRESAQAVAGFLSERAGHPVEVTVEAPAAYALENVPWTGWTVSPDWGNLTVWHVDMDDDAARREALLQETDATAAVTVRGPRWKGAKRAIGRRWQKTVELAAPLDNRSVLDGADMRPRPEGGAKPSL